MRRALTWATSFPSPHSPQGLSATDQHTQAARFVQGHTAPKRHIQNLTLEIQNGSLSSSTCHLVSWAGSPGLAAAQSPLFRSLTSRGLVTPSGKRNCMLIAECFSPLLTLLVSVQAAVPEGGLAHSRDKCSGFGQLIQRLQRFPVRGSWPAQHADALSNELIYDRIKKNSNIMSFCGLVYEKGTFRLCNYPKQ